MNTHINQDASLRPIESVAIIGSGTMGGGIAMNFANAGIPVILLDISEEAIARGLALVERNYSISVKKGKMSDGQMTQSLSLIQTSTQYDDLAQCDLVIEAVFENLALKQQVFTTLDKHCKQGAILATNTSYQDIDQIASATDRPQDVIGLHFFSPANIMKLLEVVRGDKTAKDVINTAMDLAKKINKVAVLSGNCYGFIGNRMLRPYGREAGLCLIEGASPEQIDGVMQDWGMAMGPMAVGDLAGLDIGYKAREGLSPADKGDPKSYCVADVLVEQGRLGQKSGAGYYQYDKDTRARMSDPLVMDIVESKALELNVTRRKISNEEILKRLTFAWINEGAHILGEGIAQSPRDIDTVYTFGYGFPKSLGGPMQYADSLGLNNVYQSICEFQKTLNDKNWEPAPLLKRLALSGETFDTLN